MPLDSWCTIVHRNPDSPSRVSFSDLHKILLKDPKSLLEGSEHSTNGLGAHLGEGQQEYKDLQNAYFKQQ